MPLPACKQQAGLGHRKGSLAPAHTDCGLSLAPVDMAKPQSRNGLARRGGYRDSSRARSKTASSMSSVSLPVNVFCWLG